MDIFISYSSKDSEKAYHINSLLKENGFNTWMAPESIPFGANYTNAIPNAIANCKVFLLLFSENAQRSKWVLAEVENAFKNDKTTIPYFLEDCKMLPEFDFLLSRNQHIEGFRDKARSEKILIDFLKKLVTGRQQSLAEMYGMPVKKSATVKVAEGVFEAEPEKRKVSRMVYPDGAVYEGEFLNSQRDGKGKLTYPKGNTFEGIFEKGHYRQGKFTFANGEVYEGEFQGNKYNGKGRYTFKSGMVYDGIWKNGKFINGNVYGKSGKLVARCENGKHITV